MRRPRRMTYWGKVPPSERKTVSGCGYVRGMKSEKSAGWGAFGPGTVGRVLGAATQRGGLGACTEAVARATDEHAEVLARNHGGRMAFEETKGPEETGPGETGTGFYLGSSILTGQSWLSTLVQRA